MTFDEWMEEVDKVIGKYCGLSSSDLADQPYHDWFDDGLEPDEAARTALEDEGFPFEDE